MLLEDYDITVARMLVGGVDVWLNTPLRPLEACGTSGMKAVFNGVLNCSILDGWWDEMYDGDVGWAIPSAEWQDDIEARNDLEATSLFNLLERQVVPLFYKRTDGACPSTGWRKVKASMSRVGPQVSASRMLREYTTDLYEPAARPHPRRCGPTTTPGPRRSSRWRRHLDRCWPSVVVTATVLRGAAQRRGHDLPGHRPGVAGRPRARATSRCRSSTAPSTSTTTCATRRASP